METKTNFLFETVITDRSAAVRSADNAFALVFCSNLLQVKLALLNYTFGLVSVMASDVLSNSSDTRLAVSRFITWSSEPKSPDVRKVSKTCIPLSGC